jgi:outer membrane protein, adhesin transport system
LISRYRRLGRVTGCCVLLTGVCAAVDASAQTPPSQPPGSLVVDPQQGATPRPIPTTPSPLPTTPATTLPSTAVPPSSPPPVSAPVLSRQPLRGDEPQGIERRPLLGRRDNGLPAPSANPLAIDPQADPILRLAIASGDAATFQQAIRSVVARNPAAAEADARLDEARGARNEASAAQYPVVDLSLSYFRVLDRAFSNDPQNVLERSRPSRRTDALARAQLPLIDFGGMRNRVNAGNRRIEASVAQIDDTAGQIALRGIATWYQLFGYRALVRLSEAFVEGQTSLRSAIEQRVAQGYAAPGDIAQVESYIAAAQAQLAAYRRQLASAEAQYTALTGAPAPAGFGRAPTAAGAPVSVERAQLDAETIPAVRAAKSLAEAARHDARVARSNALPSVSAGVDAGRYGVLETDNDYDIRGSVTLTQRFGGGSVQRIDQAQARARGAEASFERVRQDAVRDAAVAWSDVQALEASELAIRDNYLATRRSRDVLAERFRVARGTLFDLLGAEANYFNVAARYVETVTELDIARYALLARRGKLLEAFDIQPARMERQ